MNEINETTKQLSISVAELILQGKTKEEIMSQLQLNSTSVDRMINIVLPQVDSKLHDDVMNYIELQHNKNKSESTLDTKIEIAKQNKIKIISALTQEERNELVIRIGRQIVSGKSQEKIAREYDVAGTTIGKWLDAYLPEVDNDLYEKVMQRKSHKSKEKEASELAIKIADYIIAQQCTIKEAGEYFGIPNGSTSYYVNKVLPKADGQKFKQIRNMVDGKKKPSTSTAPTQSGLQKITYEFNTSNGTDMYNSSAICAWILKNNVSISDVAEHFNVSPKVVKSNISYMEHLDKEKYKKVFSIAYKGKYDGLGYQNAKATTLNREFVKNQNAHSVCDYIIVNKAAYDEVTLYFGITKQTVKNNVERMKDIDSDKYTKAKQILATRNISNVLSEQTECYIEKSDILGNIPIEKSIIELSKDTENIPAVEVVKNSEKDFTQDVYEAAIEKAVADGIVRRVDDLETQPVKMNFWQRVKYVFGFAN